MVADCYSFCSSATTDVLRWLSGNATKNLGILAQYWQLLAQPKNLKSGDSGYSENDMATWTMDQINDSRVLLYGYRVVAVCAPIMGGAPLISGARFRETVANGETV
ncbi:hypothetical protein GUJ93_ZPchr0013g37665 [Zizania palustris]|uniref:Uncharacterized protein n=1 Tax=Zizania palustris TaxID=103762 RepID=A0A8J6BXA0_ZIZPA|nr:hypothetical protein GUJ93_ZPchr0013g37665 [Zizania palustris]